jgi:DeoR/GlpR family transcriptional regulator of sugar metabolism
MKIFLSHSSRNKPLIREVKSYLPDHIKLWIDEKDLLIGDNLETTIKDAIETNSDYVIVFLDNYAVKSTWVIKELEWALNHEQEIERTFVLPVMLDKDVMEFGLLNILSKRKYLSCYDFSESSIRNLSTNIIAELFAWLSRDLTTKNSLIQRQNTTIKLLDEADHFTAKIADQIRIIVYPYRREQPLEIEELYRSIKSNTEFSKLTYNQFIKLLERLQQQEYLAGIVCNSISIYVEEEHFAWKTAIHTNTKMRIAKKAVSLIKSGDVIAMDAGSTTLEVAKQISNGLKLKAWKDLKIVTNSLAAANELLNTASDMGWDDKTALIRVFIIGGRIRTNTLAVVNDNLEFKHNFNDDFKNILSLLGNADISFIGTNGIHFETGFSTHDNVEIYTKQDLIRYSNRKIILADPSKFNIKEEKIFATFDENLEIITVRSGYEEIMDLYSKELEENKTKLLFA